MGTTTQHPRPRRLPLPQRIIDAPPNPEPLPLPVAPARLPAEREQAKVQHEGQGYAQDHAQHYPEQAPRADTTQRNPPSVRLDPLRTQPAGSVSKGNCPIHLFTKAREAETREEITNKKRAGA